MGSTPAYARILAAKALDDRTFSVGKYLCVWKKQADGSWKAIHDMWNADK